MRKLLAVFALAAALASCVNVNEELGSEFIATNLKYDFYTAEFDLEDVWMMPVDSLSGYSSRRINIGSVRDATYGLTKRGCAVTLVPCVSDVDFGTDPKFSRFKFQAEFDTVSVPFRGQENILQNVNVYALTEPLDDYEYYARSTVKHGTERISKGIPVINGSDSLAFDFNADFGSRYLTITSEDLEDPDTYFAKFPGIYIDTDDPDGIGGRFNMFQFNLLETTSSTSSSYATMTGNYATLYFTSTYDGEKKDTSMMFYFSPWEFEDLDSLYYNNLTASQYVFNVDYHESDPLSGKAMDKIYVEGGSGLKPVIKAEEIRQLVSASISANGGDPSTALITKATIEMPFEFPDDYDDMFLYPDMLSPTMKISTDTTVAFAGLTDASASSENQGDINRSLGNYAPDITHHVQQIIREDSSEDISDYDIWMLVMHNETTTTSDASASEMADYYQQLAYYSYYNQLYGGYSGYGYGSSYGYGSYGYNNYYNYMMMAQYAASAATSTTSSYEMDKDRYYDMRLNGPASSGSRPKLKVTYAIPRE